MNTFSYIFGANYELQQGLIIWRTRINEYLNLYYQGDKGNAKGTIFFMCISKINSLEEALDDPDNYENLEQSKIIED